MPLLIVESPTKAKTIAKFLGKGYTVLSSFGHIRDLPESKTGVDVEHGFTPTYEIPDDKKEKVAALRKAAKGIGDIYLATDEDREGEAIAWHIAEVLKIDPATAQRITFHEITKPAIARALEHPRTIDMHLVDAQQTRRILDRLVGYELSPLLWKKVQRGLSAGRVQSVAVRLVVEREEERNAFTIQEYWSVTAQLAKGAATFDAELTHIGEKKLDKLDLADAAAAQRVVDAVTPADFVVQSVEEKEASRKPPTPLTTSTLQQDAHNRLGFSAKQTMTLAQKLYETGRITYMRTDSQNLAENFLNAVQTYARATWGDAYAQGATHYKTNKKGAQEAHEAIRPTDISTAPDMLKNDLEAGQWKLYDLIWRRTLASQLPPARILRTGVDITASGHTFRANGSMVTFPGFLQVWNTSEETLLPPLANNENLGRARAVVPERHETEPPARYSDATLIKAMEEYGIGRPSTYAPTLATIVDRGYVLRDERNKLFPSDIARIVTRLLKEHFPNIVDYSFTAEMEQKLDDIAEGTHNWQMVMASFYGPFHEQIVQKGTELTRADVMEERTIGKDPATGLDIVVRTGRFGPYVQLGVPTDAEPKPRRASLEKHMVMDTVTLEQALQLLSLPRVVGLHPNGEEIIANNGRFGPYLKCGEVNISLPPTDHPATVTLERALAICAEGVEKKKAMMTPIATLGVDPESKGTILVKNGRYGPYVTDGTTNVTIPKAKAPESVTREEAIQLLQKKRASPRRGRRARKTTA